eukprot:8635270-Heterocapsa_arctica.AAC.1
MRVLEMINIDTKEGKLKLNWMENYKPRTTDMAVIVTHTEMGNVYVQMKSVADNHMRKERLCMNTLVCTTCKAFAD